MASPIKFIRASISNVSVAASKTVGGVAGVAYQWNATLTVTAQAHSDSTTTPVANYYTGRNLVVGDWVTSDGTGKSLKIVAITSATDTTVACKLEDVDNFNAITDETGNLDGMIPNGPGIGAYVFAVKNNVPILGNIPVALPGNLAGTDFANNIQSRFAALANVGIDPATGKLDASILPAPVVGGAAGAVKIPSTGDFSVDANGNLSLKNKGTANGVASLDASGYIPVGQLTNVIGAAPTALNTLAKLATALNNDPNAFTTLTTTMDAKVATAVANLTGTASPSFNTFAEVESAFTAEKATREAAEFVLQNNIDGIIADVGSPGGIASLDATGKVPASQLPSYVDDVAEYTNLAGFPASGETGKIYVAKDTNKIYRWSGSAYIEISSAGTADTATKLATARTISLTGAVTGSVSFDGSANVSIATVISSLGDIDGGGF